MEAIIQFERCWLVEIKFLRQPTALAAAAETEWPEAVRSHRKNVRFSL